MAPFNVRHEKAHPLIGPSPLRIQLTVIPKGYQCPEDVDGKEGNGECDESCSLHSALELNMVLRSSQTQPARDGSKGCDKQEASHVTQQSALLTAWTGVLQPPSEGLWSPLNSELGVAELTVAGVGGGQPLLKAALVHFTKCPCAVTRGQEYLPSSSLMADPTHAHVTLQTDSLDNSGKWASIFSGHFGDVLGLGSGV